MANDSSVCVILLNYRNAKDTISCLDSLLELTYPNLKIMVCDNGSKDDSTQRFIEWAERLIIQKKLSKYAILNSNSSIPEFEKKNSENIALYILENKVNRGYAAGMNLGISHALYLESFKYLWILNNDTTVDKNALTYLVEKMDKDSSIGLCGSTILYAHDPSRVQALGGFLFNRVFGLSKQIGNGELWSAKLIQEYTESRIERKMFGIQGAAIFLRKEFLEKIGMMDEEYFLYSEEQDWAMRSKGIFKLGYASKSLVYHQEGKTTGSNSYQSKKSLDADFYLTRSRILYAKKYTPLFLPAIFMTIFLIACKRFLTGQPLNGVLILLSAFFNIKRSKNIKKEYDNNYLSPFDKFRKRKIFKFLFGNKND